MAMVLRWLGCKCRRAKSCGVRLLFLDDRQRSPGAWWMSSSMFASDMKIPIRFEVIAEVHRPQLQHRFGHGRGPAHPRPLHPVLDQVLASPFHHTGGDRPALTQVLVVT